MKIVKKKDDKNSGGIISEIEFVNLFATQKQKDKYILNGNLFSGANKTTVIKQAKKLCDIEELGNRQYKINYYYKYPVPKNFDQMNDGLYKVMIPLILINLINENIYEGENITFTYNKWYKMIKLINDNYTNIKQNIKYTSEKKKLSTETLHEYFDRTDESLIYYFKKSLEYLKQANLFDYQEIKWVCIREIDKTVDNSIEYNEFENVIKDIHKQIEIQYIYRRATQDELKFIRKCEQDACDELGILISDHKEKYYGKKSLEFSALFRNLLSEKNIMFSYKAYEIVSTDKDIEHCYELLNSFDLRNKSKFSEHLSKMFIEKIIDNANKRQSKKIDNNLLKLADLKKIMSDYKKIANLTIGAKSKLLEDIPKLLTESDINLINAEIDEGLFVKINGEKVDIKIKGE